MGFLRAQLSQLEILIFLQQCEFNLNLCWMDLNVSPKISTPSVHACMKLPLSERGTCDLLLSGRIWQRWRGFADVIKTSNGLILYNQKWGEPWPDFSESPYKRDCILLGVRACLSWFGEACMARNCGWPLRAKMPTSSQQKPPALTHTATRKLILPIT